MASSRKSPAADLSRAVAAILKRWVRPGQRVAAALSGGVDSVVLLDLLLKLLPRYRFKLSALHVNHGISPNAFRWERFCREFCRVRGVPFKVFRVKVVKTRGASLEAAAREARYGVLASYPADFIVLAQHRDDQAETLLLQLLRGAGVKGLSAMPLVRPLAPEVSGDLSRFAIRNPLLLRPLLGVTRNAIEAYAGRRRLEWMEDESNEDTALDRNYLRWRVLPLLAARFPGYREALSRAADHFAEAAELLGDLAAIDGGEGIPGNTLPLAILRGLPKSRAKNLLRHFLAANGVPFPSAVRLEELLRQLRTAGADSKVRIAVGEFDVRCFRGGAYVLRMRATVPRSFLKRWRGEKRISLDPLPGVIAFRERKGAGISRDRLAAEPVTLRLRRGGERLRPDGRRPRRSLKNLLQESAIPPWERETLPLLFSGDNLVWAPGIGVDCGYQAQPGEVAVAVAWEPA